MPSLSQLPVATLEPMPTAAVAWATVQTSPVHSLRLESQVATSIALDETFIYWTPAPNSGRILRYPLDGGTVETIATSRFTRFGDGYLGSFGLLRRGDWLIFTDTRENDNSVWAVRALNVMTGQERLVLDEPGDPISAPGPDYDADDDWVVWTRTEHSKDAGCDVSILAMQNLKTGQMRELDRVCTATNYSWALPHLWGDKLIVEQDLPNSKGGGNNIYLFDLTTGKRTALTENRSSSMPTMSGRWLVWKNAPRFFAGNALVIYDLVTGQRWSIRSPLNDPSDPLVAGHWLYWGAGPRPFVGYNLESGTFLTVATPGVDEAFDSVAVAGNIAAWDRHPNFSSGKLTDHILEWRTLP